MEFQHTVSDKDKRFQVRFWQELQKAFGIKLNFSSSYHPKIDGKTKRANQILEESLCIGVPREIGR